MPSPLIGTCRVPGDKSLSHRALLVGALTDGAARGPVRITGLGSGGDNRSTARILRRLGVRIERAPAPQGPPPRGDAPRTEAPGTDTVLVHGVGLDGLRAPDAAGGPLRCGNSGTTMRLLLGVLAGQPFEATLVGDASLSRRPMGRVLGPLSAMGLTVLRTAPGQRAPLTVRGRRPLEGLEYRSPVASAQVKSALLLAGLWAGGPTTVHEPGPSRDHTERLLTYLGCPVDTTPAGDGSSPWRARLQPPPPGRRALDVRPLDVPGDLSSAAFLLAAAALLPGSRVTVRDVGTNPTRTGVLDALAAMGVEVERHREREVCGEPRADLTVASRAGEPLAPFEIAGALAVRALDELPLLATVAARARGVSHLRDAAELRVKESDRVAKTAALLRSFGVPVDEHPDGLTVHGDPERPLRPGRVDAAGDHRVAMCASILGLLAPPGTRVTGAAAIATSFPTFYETLEALGAGPALARLDVS